MKHWKHFNLIKGRLEDKTLVLHAEINQRLTSDLNFRELIAQILAFAHTIPHIVHTETRANTSVSSLVRESVEIVIVREE